MSSTRLSELMTRLTTARRFIPCEYEQHSTAQGCAQLDPASRTMHAPAFASSLARSLAAPRASASASRRAPESRRRERRTASTATTTHDVPSRRLVVALDDAAAAADPVHRSAASASRRAALATIALASAATAGARAPYPARALVDDANARRVFEQSRRSVVGLADYTPGGANGGYAPRGTGVVWAAVQQQPGDDDNVGVGYVVTNYHVIAPDHLPGRNDDGGKKGSAPAGPALRVAVADAKTGEPVWYDAVVVGAGGARAVVAVHSLGALAALEDVGRPEVRGEDDGGDGGG